MKKQTFFLLAGSLIMLSSSAQNSVGIGTSTPNATSQLHVDAGSSNRGLLVTGVYNLGAVPDLGAGNRLMFYPGKPAFRAGRVTGAEWDNANVGRNSVAFGYNNIASGDASTAMGEYSHATGTTSTSFGSFSTASGTAATAMGMLSVAAGQATTAMGDNSVAKGFASTVVGMYNDSLLTTNEMLFLRSATSPLFIVGNGEFGARSNAFVVRKNGTVGVGNIVPEFTLDVANRMRLRSGGDAYNTAGIWMNDLNNTGLMGFMGVYNDNTLGFYGTGSSWGLVMNTASGNVGIGTVSPLQKLHVVGNICATGTIGACSDIRYKTNFLPLASALSSVMQIQPIYYDWKQEFKDKGFAGERQLGFSAQEIETFFPEIVQTDANGYKAVDYSRMTPVLVQALKEQHALIEKQSIKLEQLQKDNEELKARLEKIERLLQDGKR